MRHLPTPIVWLSLLALVAVFPFFFVGSGGGGNVPNGVGRAVWPALWNLGHGAYFALFSLVWLHLWPVPIPRRSWVVTSVVLALGLAIETFQFMVGRDFSFTDVWRNLVGAWAVLVFWPGVMPAMRGQTVIRLVVAGLVLMELLYWLLPVATDVRLDHQVPVLFNQDNPQALDNWEGKVDWHTDDALNLHNVLRIDMGTTRYSGANLIRLPTDWRGYEALTFRLFNPDNQGLTFSLRINDRAHDRGAQAYANRFNVRLEVPPGWSTHRFALTDIARAPAARTMDMHQISQLGLFASELDQPRTVYLTDLRLQ